MTLRESEALLKAEDQKWKWLEDWQMVGMFAGLVCSVFLVLAGIGYLAFILFRALGRLIG